MANHFTETLDQIMSYGDSLKMAHAHTEDESLHGRTLTHNGRELINFGSCSYLGLEHHPALIEGTIEAVKKFGTQFSSSRTFASLGLYQELESSLETIFEQPVLVSATTTLGHFAAMPVVVEDNDAIILDMQVHSSVQMAAQILKARGNTITIIRHNDMEALEKKIQELSAKHDKVWYMADGVYSMYGDYAPIHELEALLNKHKKFHLYIDDAHGSSWTGKHGRGWVRSQIEHHEKMLLTISLNKSFAGAGGAIVFPDKEMQRLVRNCGGTFIFCGPIQPPMLGAICASTRLHLSEEIKIHQQKIADLVAHCNQRLREAGLPQFEETDSPLFFIPVGLPNVTMNMVNTLKKDGIFVNPGIFPAVPMKRGGVRFMMNGHLTKADVDALVDSLAAHYEAVLAEFGSSSEKVAKTFRIPAFQVKSPKTAQIAAKSTAAELRIQTARTIDEIDPTDWDRIFLGKGNFNVSSLKMLEKVFAHNEEAENQWDFHYFIARDQEDQIVAATFYTCALVKDDMFAPAEVSKQIESQRVHDPLHLCSKSVMLGSLITKGEHLFIDREHPQWKSALQTLIQEMQDTQAEQGANQLQIRDFVGEHDAEMDQFFLEMGLSIYSLPATNTVEHMNWKDHDGYMDRLGSRYRSDLRREVLKHKEEFSIVTEKPTTIHEIKEVYALYNNVFENSYEMNVHRLPFAFFRELCKNPHYDVIRLYLKDDPRPEALRKPVAVMFSFFNGPTYTALIVGMDYQYLRSHEIYKQALYRTVWRAWDLECDQLDLAYTAELAKKKVGARPKPAYAYVQAVDHFNFAQIAAL